MTSKRYAPQLNNILQVQDQMSDLNTRKNFDCCGARPQFIKAGILSKKLEGEFNEVLLHTGQHYDANMSDVFLLSLGLRSQNIIST